MKPAKPIARQTPLHPGTKRMRRTTPIGHARPKSSPTRKAAHGKPCQIRLPGICNGNPETTVLAHYRLAGYCGAGMKPIDALGAWACSACHDEADRRTRKLESEFVRLAFAEGVMRTIAEIARESE